MDWLDVSDELRERLASVPQLTTDELAGSAERWLEWQVMVRERTVTEPLADMAVAGYVQRLTAAGVDLPGLRRRFYKLARRVLRARNAQEDRQYRMGCDTCALHCGAWEQRDAGLSSPCALHGDTPHFAKCPDRQPSACCRWCGGPVRMVPPGKMSDECRCFLERG